MSSRAKNSAYDTKDQINEEKTATASASAPVNEGLQGFEQIRREWQTASGRFSVNPSATQRGYNPFYQQQMRRYPVGPSGKPTPAAVNPDDIYDRLFSGNRDGTLPESIPLGQMIELLTEEWESQGLYD